MWSVTREGGSVCQPKCVVGYLGLSAQVCGRLPRSVSPSVWSVTSVCQPKCVVGYLGLSALVFGRLPRSASPRVVGYLGLSAQVWSVTSACQPKCGRL